MKKTRVTFRDINSIGLIQNHNCKVASLNPPQCKLCVSVKCTQLVGPSEMHHQLVQVKCTSSTKKKKKKKKKNGGWGKARQGKAGPHCPKP